MNRNSYVWGAALLLGVSILALRFHARPTERAVSQKLAGRALPEGPLANKQKVLAAYGKLPLRFEANHGQADPQAKFLSRGPGYSLFLTPTEAVLVLRKPNVAAGSPRHSVPVAPGSVSSASSVSSAVKGLSPTVLRIRLIRVNLAAEIRGENDLPGKSNYFIGNDPTKWRTNVTNYARVRYENVYPGVDLVFYGNAQQLEYDFVVAPGADPKSITLACTCSVGAYCDTPLQIDANGDLVIQTEGGDVRLHRPTIYQEINGAKHAIPGGYVLKGKHQVGFQVAAAYDARKPLIIDPVLSYFTYLGGSGGDIGRGMGVDATGNAYVAGTTRSNDFPTVNAFQSFVAARGICPDAVGSAPLHRP